MSIENISIRETLQSDLMDVVKVEREAFGSEEEAQLVGDLLNDESAKPIVSLLAFIKDEAVGHILFTRSTIIGRSESILTHILAPLAVKPKFQSQGIGGKLVKEGLALLTELNVQLVFVLGHPDYYPKFGFIPDAESLGFPPPYPIPKKDADAWMMKPLKDEDLTKFQGEVVCANAMNKPEYWRE